jgi:hypothetical protein
VEGKLELYKSTDNGITWIHLNVPVNEPNAMPDFPHLSVKDDTINISYTEYNSSFENSIKYVRTSDGGTSWSVPSLISSADDYSCMGSTMERGYDGSLFISWAHAYQPEPLLLAKSTDEGLNFCLPDTVAASDHDSYVTQLVCSKKSYKIGILYYTVHSFGPLYYVGSDNYGLTWHPPFLLSINGTMPSGDFDSSGYLHLTYTESLTPDSIAYQYVYSENNGLTFSSPVHFADKSRIACMCGYIGANSATFYGSDNNIHAFWIDWRTENCILNHSFWNSGYVSVAKTEKAARILVYPNPAKDRISIDCPERQNVNLYIYNLIGETVLQRKLANAENEIDISLLSTGMYIVKVTGLDWTVQKKMIRGK